MSQEESESNLYGPATNKSPRSNNQTAQSFGYRRALVPGCNMPEKKDAVRELFAELAREFVAEHLQLPSTTRVIVDSDSARLEVPSVDENGFSVTLAVSNSELTLHTDRGFHEHFDIERDIEGFFRQILGLTRDILSPEMRLRELRSNDRPYRWFLEAYDGSEWVQEFEMGLLVFNFFGKRSHRIFQNRILEGYPIE